MDQPSPFDTIESAQEFLTVLTETIAEAKQEVQTALAVEQEMQLPRRKDALQIAAYNLEKLQFHMAKSHLILNDLRSLRRLLFAERGAARAQPAASEPVEVKAKPAKSGNHRHNGVTAAAAGD
jgi:hypothetical protein